ncbi:hypothetical protein QHH03_15430 [Aphanizomenon sp. 202]|nr:hypothetical protein [Aphanizomenon sp. 202]
MANATLRYHSQSGYGFYVKLTPKIKNPRYPDMATPRYAIGLTR